MVNNLVHTEYKCLQSRYSNPDSTIMNRKLSLCLTKYHAMKTYLLLN